MCTTADKASCQVMYLGRWLRGNSALSFYLKCGNLNLILRSWMKLREMQICTTWPATW